MSQNPIPFNISFTQSPSNLLRQHKVLKYVTDIDSSLRLQINVIALLNRVTTAVCEVLGFRYSALYIVHEDGRLHAQASYGISSEEEEYLRQHPLPNAVAALLIDERYRISGSYFIPTESPLWENEVFAGYFLTMSDEQVLIPNSSSASNVWKTTDMIVVPLMSADNTLLGLLTPDAPLDGLRPDVEMMECLELLAAQAALIIEGAQLYEAVKQRSEERTTLVEIGHALFAPEALHDLHTVYETIHEQVQHIMPVDAFMVSRYFHATDKLVMDYIVDEGVVYPPENYTAIPLLARKLFLKEEKYFLFSTQEEYKCYRDAVENISSEEEYDDVLGSHRLSESILFVPLHFGKEVLGMLSVQSYTPHDYTAHHVEMLLEIALQAGIAITNARLYTELREAVQRAEEADQLKNHFLLTASHELRTPLTAIQGYLELLSMHGASLSEKDRNRFISSARRASEEVILLLGNVMDTSHVDQKEITLSLSNVQLSHALLPVLDILGPNAIRQGRNVEVYIDDALHVHADESRLRQILLNVLGNALKYTPIKTPITIHAERLSTPVPHMHISPTVTEHSVVLLSISDRGDGIAPEDQERLFTKFVRLPNALKSTQKGSGLGLYLCRQLVEAMNGAIWVESTGVPGEGTTFFIALPHAFP